MPTYRAAAAMVAVLIGCSKPDYPDDPPQGVNTMASADTAALEPPPPQPVGRCDGLRQQHARSVSGATFERWVKTNWPSGRFDDCLSDRPQPARQPTRAEQRHCYTIAITYGHMRESSGKQAERRAWFDMDCQSFLGRSLPSGPLPADEETRYTAALTALTR